MLDLGAATVMGQYIDEGLYSRQIYVLGHEAMCQMQSARIMIHGLSGAGVEIAKNVILAGVKSVVLVDPTVVSVKDLSSGYYFSESDIGRISRAEAAFTHLASLNPYVQVAVHKGDFDVSLITSYGPISVLVWSVQGPIESQTCLANEYCIEHNVKFIQADVFGVCGMVFVDNGDEFFVRDPDGEVPLEGILAHITNEPDAIITCYDETRHSLSSGDLVMFSDVEGMTELNGIVCEITVLTPFSFKIHHDTTRYTPYTNAGRFHQIKSSKTVHFSRLRHNLIQPKFSCIDISKEQSVKQVHLLHRAVSHFRFEYNREPRHDYWDDADEIVKMAERICCDMSGDKICENIDKNLVRTMARCVSHCLAPVAAVIGAIASQEALKSCTGKFTPLNQLFYFDCVEIIPDTPDDCSDFLFCREAPSRYCSQIAIIGNKANDRLQNCTTFLVGAGAIGCEILKNWAMMGVACSPSASITVTDMDLIERSNLNRQFLFRDNDVGQLKSLTAANAVRAMNPQINIVAHNNRVGADSEDVYDDHFWDSLDVVCTALDNVDARLYVDQRCVYYKKPLMESGTMGTKGNSQIVIPYLTESYGATRDPPEQSIPLCTLKNFPSQIAHTIQWARDIFEGWFKVSADTVNQYLSDFGFLEALRKENPNALLETVHIIEDCLSVSRPLSLSDCGRWARLQFEKEFNHNIRQLLVTFPQDSLTSTGTPFWSGPKRAPGPISFNAQDPLHMAFIVSAANLRAYNYGLNANIDAGFAKEVMNSLQVPEFCPRPNAAVLITDENADGASDGLNTTSAPLEADLIISKLPPPSHLAGYRLSPIEFEKDDDTNHHIDFVTACSNLRARNYRIPEASASETKRIAGRIIPAIATTTSLVSGLICIEMYKVVQNLALDKFRNCFVNLALPLFSSAEPVAPIVNCSALGPNATRVLKWTQWDYIDVPLGNCTLSQLIDYLKKEYAVHVEMLSFGASLLFAFFSPAATRSYRLPKRITELISEVSKQQFPTNRRYCVLEACVTNSNDEDVDLPSLRLNLEK